MKIESCTGKAKKEAICKKYYIKPLVHTILLEGQDKQGCCGKLTGEYYAFSYKLKGSYDDEEQYFYVGKNCAESFLKLIKHDGLTLFNPLKSISNSSIIQTGGSISSNNSKKDVAPINIELIKAIHIICIAWGEIPKSAMADVLNFTRRKPDTANYRGIEIINSVISKDYNERKLNEIIDELRNDNELKDFEFPLINEYVNSKEGIINYFE